MTVEDVDRALRPGLMLAGLAVGIQSLWLSFVYLWPIAWLIPAALALALLPVKRARSFRIGVAAAACGALVAVLTMAILLAAGPDRAVPPPTAVPSTSQSPDV